MSDPSGKWLGVRAGQLKRHAFIDIETTGLDPAVDEVVELGIVLVHEGLIFGRHRWRLRHEKPLSAMIQALTGLPERADASNPSLAEAWPEIGALLAGHTVVAHNASFERSFLKPLEALPLVDSCEVTHFLHPQLRSHSLDALVRWAEVGEGARHRALDDAEDTFRVVQVALDRATGRESLLRVAAETGGPLGELLSWGGYGVAAAPVVREVSAQVRLPEGLRALETERPEDSFSSLCQRFTSQGVDVAVPVFRLGDVPDEVPRRLPPASRICRQRLLQLLDLKRFSPIATGYVRRWLEHTPHGDRATLSGWMSERWPDVRLLGLLALADADCRCFDPGPGAAVVTHEAALAQLGSKPFVILDAARFTPRPLVLEGRRLRELRALYELAEAPFDDERLPTGRAVLDLFGPPSLEAPVAEGLARAVRWFAQQLTPVEPVDVTAALKSANALLVHDVVTTEARWLAGLGLGGLEPERRPVAVGSEIRRVNEQGLDGVVLGLGTISADVVTQQVNRAPGQVRLGLTCPAAIRLANWWPGQPLGSLEVSALTVLGPIRADDLRRLQLALPPSVTRITLLDPPPIEPRAPT